MPETLAMTDRCSGASEVRQRPAIVGGHQERVREGSRGRGKRRVVGRILGNLGEPVTVRKPQMAGVDSTKASTASVVLR